MDNNFSIGKRIRELRNQKHLSQEQLALSAEITTAYLDRLREMKRTKQLQLLQKYVVRWG